MASYSLDEFLGAGVLKDMGGRFAEDGWDDVPTLKVIAAEGIEALGLKNVERDALELRIYLHNRSLMKYADKMEASGIPLVTLLSTKPSDLASKFRMRKIHVMTFVDTSISCGVQMPPDLPRVSSTRGQRPRLSTASRVSEHGDPSVFSESLPFELHKSVLSDSSSFDSSLASPAGKFNAAAYPMGFGSSFASSPRKSNAAAYPMGFGSSFASSPRKFNAAAYPMESWSSFASPARKSNAAAYPMGFGSSLASPARKSNAAAYPMEFGSSIASPARKSNAAAYPMEFGSAFASPARKSNAAAYPMGFGSSFASSPRKSNAAAYPMGFDLPSMLRPLDDTKSRAPKGVFAAATSTSRSICGLVKAPNSDNSNSNVAKISDLEKVLLRPLAPDHRNGVDTSTLMGVKKMQPFKASSLWAKKATLFFCIRRPGCVMCRAEAHQLFARKPIFDALGIQLVAVLLEDVDEEVWAFWPRFWAGMVVLDERRDFFRALGGGKLMRDNLFTGFLLNPVARLNWKRAVKTGIRYNNKGEGLIKGGLFIVRKGKAGVAYQFAEKNFGDWAPLDEILQVCHVIREEND